VDCLAWVCLVGVSIGDCCCGIRCGFCCGSVVIGIAGCRGYSGVLCLGVAELGSWILCLELALSGFPRRIAVAGLGLVFYGGVHFSVGLYGFGVVVELISAVLLTGWGSSSWLGTTCGALEATFLVG
jgi:hypothetical protein